ncbi:sulfatase-like hydrolase/transferase [Dyella terrae]|uniref:sulfatase-like hydrolase/transferase n=1 Tax=Dyella terrae TaxID=522259 RepID=UPI001EFC61A6|nr:sulfatase-like hydrolase/transferase [Dyella terrae]ULU25071.1 phosphoethanolamine transferase [Dyella terrae]
MTLSRRIPWAPAALILLLMAPNLARLGWEHGPVVWVSAMVVPVFLLAALFAIFGRWPWIACLLLAPLAALAPAELFYVLKYHHPSVYNVLGTIAATNTAETIGYFGMLLVPVALCMLAALALAVVAAIQSYRRQWQWLGSVRNCILLLSLGLPAALFLSGALKPGSTRLQERAEQGWQAFQSLTPTVEPGYPFGAIVRFVKFRQDWAYVADSRDRLKDFRFHAAPTSRTTQRQIYVLVIGESSSRSHWSLFGYERPTNPELTKLSHVLPVTNMLTSYAATQEAVPIILTRKPVTSFHELAQEPTILKAMAEAGFDTWWISNQVAVGKYESPVTIYALEANHTEYLNRSTWTSDQSLDEKLLRPLSRAIETGTSNEFIVLHMMGSHLRYDLRYPADLGQFHPTLSDPRPSGEPDNRNINSYDNTILYTDHVLAQIIGMLKNSGAVTALWYESDHGEALASPSCDYSGHGYGTRDEFQIPVVFWYSDAYAETFQDHIDNLSRNARQPTISANTFESLIDMADITFPGHDPTMSVFSAQWAWRPRIVHSGWELDYDKAQFSPKCNLVEPIGSTSGK